MNQNLKNFNRNIVLLTESLDWIKKNRRKGRKLCFCVKVTLKYSILIGKGLGGEYAFDKLNKEDAEVGSKPLQSSLLIKLFFEVLKSFQKKVLTVKEGIVVFRERGKD